MKFCSAPETPNFIYLFHTHNLHHGWRKFLNMTFWNAPERPYFTSFFHTHSYTMVEENFEIWHSETLQKGLILLPTFIFIPSPWLKKFWNMTFWNVPERPYVFYLFFHNNTFTMVEENFEIWHSETLQNGLILLLSFILIPSPWLKKILLIYYNHNLVSIY